MDTPSIRNIVTSATSRLDMWLRLINLAQIQQMAEVGVWEGEFAEAALRECQTVQHYFMIDPWRRLDQWNKPMNISDAAFESVRNEALQRTDFADERRIVLRGTTLEVIGDIPDESLDLIYIDGDHTLRGVTIDLVAIYAKAKPGRYIGGDDFCPTIWQHAMQFEPTMVFPFAINFAEAVGAAIYCLPFNQFLMRKPDNGERGFAVIDFTGQYGAVDLLSQLSLQTLVGKSIRENMPSPLKRVLRSIGRGLNPRK